LAEVTVVTRAILAFRGGRRERDLCRRLTLGSDAPEQRLGRGEDAGRFRAHAKDTSGARRQDLEVEIVMADSELLAGVAEGLLDRLAGELAVCVAKGSHFSVVSLFGLSAGGR
jgi:hypothetical protein